MLRDYAVHFSQCGAQPGLLQDHAVDARTISTDAFGAWDFLLACRSFDVASFARSRRHRFLGSRYWERLGVPTSS